MRPLFVLWLTLAGCPGEEGGKPSAEETDQVENEDPLPDAGDCLPTLGDRCGCIPQCLTQAQIDAIEDVCDLECETGTELTWACEQVDGECEVVP